MVNKYAIANSGSTNDKPDDPVDDIVDSLAVPGNTVGESPLQSEGMDTFPN